MAETLGILLISGEPERAHYAWLMAAAAAAVGRRVVLFATNEGCRALLAHAPDAAARDSATADPAWPTGVATSGTLRDAAIELGVELLACDAGLRLAHIEPGQLLARVTVAGVPAFLSAASGGQIVTL